MKKMLEEKRILRIIFEVNPLMLEGMNKSVYDLFSFWDEFDYNLYLLNESGKLEIFNQWPENLVGDCIAIIDDVERGITHDL